MPHFLMTDPGQAAEFADEGEEFLDPRVEVRVVGEQVGHLLAEGEGIGFG